MMILLQKHDIARSLIDNELKMLVILFAIIVIQDLAILRQQQLMIVLF